MSKNIRGVWLSKEAILHKMNEVMDDQDVYLPIHFKEWVLDEVTPITENKGEWVRNIHDKTICSRCGAEKSQWYDEYCSHCGADMRKEQT